jgi:UDP-galactopyranose mutase
MLYDRKYIVVGAGLFGSVMAERIASELDEKVMVIDRRSHIGGNCYTTIDAETGIEDHKYGSHIFHTENEAVWSYINQFTSFNSYQHKVFSEYKGKTYAMPVCLQTINQFFNINLKPYEVKAFIQKEVEREGITDPKNFEEKAITLIGRSLYEAFIKGYSTKQWETDLTNLPAEIITRLPVRDNYNSNYFSDPHQGIPSKGYTHIFESMLSHPNIKVQLDTDFLDVRDKVTDDQVVIYTGPIDEYFGYTHGVLGWRTVEFEYEHHNHADHLGNSVVNYADLENPYTRSHEYKHYHPEWTYRAQKTFTVKETSRKAKKGEEPYYPVNTEADKEVLAKYEAEVAALPNMIFGGRLGLYKYFDMDDSIENALNVFNEKFKT